MMQLRVKCELVIAICKAIYSLLRQYLPEYFSFQADFLSHFELFWLFLGLISNFQYFSSHFEQSRLN